MLQWRNRQVLTKQTGFIKDRGTKEQILNINNILGKWFWCETLYEKSDFRGSNKQ